jgi:hypothetical protein
MNFSQVRGTIHRRSSTKSDIIDNSTLRLRGGHQTSTYLEWCNFIESAVHERAMSNTYYILHGLEMVH